MTAPTSFATISIEYQTRLIGNLRAETDLTMKQQVLNAFQNELNGVKGGVPGRNAQVRTVLASVAASMAVTVVQASVSDGDTITIGGTALTARTAPTLTSEFAIGASNTAIGTNLKNAINANATLQKFVWASNVLGVVTIHSVFPGPVGNFILVSKSSTGITLVGSALASGASDEVDALQFGFTPS